MDILDEIDRTNDAAQEIVQEEEAARSAVLRERLIALTPAEKKAVTPLQLAGLLPADHEKWLAAVQESGYAEVEEELAKVADFDVERLNVYINRQRAAGTISSRALAALHAHMLELERAANPEPETVADEQKEAEEAPIVETKRKPKYVPPRPPPEATERYVQVGLFPWERKRTKAPITKKEREFLEAIHFDRCLHAILRRMMIWLRFFLLFVILYVAYAIGDHIFTQRPFLYYIALFRDLLFGLVTVPVDAAIHMIRTIVSYT